MGNRVDGLLALRDRDQEVLRVETGDGWLALACALPRPAVHAVALEDAGFHGVGQIGSHDLLANAVAQHSILYREHDFDALVEITRHPVGAGQIDLLLPPIGEIKNAAVLEKTPHNAAHANAIADAANAGPQRADAAHDQIDFDAGLGGGVERRDDILVE